MKKHSILIVDDEPENLNLLFNILGSRYPLLKASAGDAALKLLRRHDVHVILTDQRMPGMSGVELLEKAREIRPDAVRMLITAYPDVDNAVQAINRGQVKRYITKPFDPAELVTVIGQELEHVDLVLSHRRLNTDLRQTAEKLTVANQELRDLHQVKDQFLANCSHELRTPLVSGMGYVDLLLSGGLGPLPPDQKRGLRTAQRNLERLLGLIDNLLALARARFRPEKLRIRRFALRPLLDECVSSLRGRARKTSLRIRMTAPPRLPPVAADEAKVHSVVTNILANAEKFTPAQAVIDVRVTRTGRKRCRVSVRDNGPGPDQAGEKIRAFQTTSDPRTTGMGIGLALARQFLREHGCDIRIERGRRGGAVVRFDLPLAND